MKLPMKIMASLASVAMLAGFAACGVGSASRGSGDSNAATIKKGDVVGISMPTKADQRWNVDGANLKKDLQNAGYKVVLSYANNSPSQQSTDINNLISAGAKAIIVAAVDGTAVGPAVAQAKAAGDTVIAYDRLIMNTDAVNYYVTFNLEMTGTLEANYIIDKLNLKNGGCKDTPCNIEMFAGSDDDNNAPYFFKGAWDLLQPYFKSGQLKDPSNHGGGITASFKNSDWKKISVHAWDQNTAQSQMDAIMTQAYAHGEKLSAVLSPYDAISQGIINSIKNHRPDMVPGTSTWPIITGQDGMDIAIHNIYWGMQGQTVFKNVALLAKQTTKIITTLAAGKKPGNFSGKMDNGKIKVPTYYEKSQQLTKANLHTEVEVGFITESQYQKDIQK
ncbi:sugar-binding protein [Bifidobacterium aquikefiri]|uniref:substrate-binding domain-containing protein n=1 Tax=Bifidobacterium aquikefiri TaxID=1653207 RepID=UPI0039ED8011